jgi:hypothetical protein
MFNREISRAADTLTVKKLERAKAGNLVGEKFEEMEKARPEDFEAAKVAYLDAITVWNIAIYSCAVAEADYLRTYKDWNGGMGPPPFKHLTRE